MDLRRTVRIQRAASSHPEMVVVSPDGYPRGPCRPVRRREDADDVGARAAHPLEINGERRDPGQREGPLDDVPAVEDALDVGEIPAAPGQETLPGSAVHGHRRDPLPSRRGDVEPVGRQLARVRRQRAGHDHEARRARLAGGDPLVAQARAPLEERAPLAFGPVRVVAQRDHDLVADVVTGVAVVGDFSALGKADSVADEVEIPADLARLRKGECPDPVGAEPPVPAGAQRRAAVLHPLDEREREPEPVASRKGLRPGSGELGDQVAPRLRRAGRAHRPAVRARGGEREHVGADFIGRLGRRGGRTEREQRDGGDAEATRSPGKGSRGLDHVLVLPNAARRLAGPPGSAGV